ncbi:MAG: hypothetical protein VB980_04720 [Opitutales bacterium]|jgi:hypothetical protein
MKDSFNNAGGVIPRQSFRRNHLFDWGRRIQKRVLPLGSVILLALICSFAARTKAWGQTKSHFLETNLERDVPVPLYKSLWAILEENQSVFAIIGGIALLITIAWWLQRHLRKNESNEKMVASRDPYEEAMESLEALANESNRMEAKPFTFRLSEVLRTYVQGRFELPALELTGEEFIRETVEHKFFRNHYDELLREFIDKSEVVKYSRESMDGEGLKILLGSALHFVKDTHRRLEEENASVAIHQEDRAA